MKYIAIKRWGRYLHPDVVKYKGRYYLLFEDHVSIVDKLGNENGEITDKLFVKLLSEYIAKHKNND